MRSTRRKAHPIEKNLTGGYLGQTLEPLIPEKIKSQEVNARKEMEQGQFEQAGKQFYHLANWYEGQRESTLREKWEISGNYHLFSADCFAACAKQNLPGHNWHELSGLAYSHAVECFLNNQENKCFRYDVFKKGIRQFQLLPEGKKIFRNKRIVDSGKLSAHLIDLKYKKTMRMLDEHDFNREYDILSIDYTKWKAKTSNSSSMKLWYWFWGLSSNYGTSVIRWVCWCFFLICFFACFYYFTSLSTERGLTGFSRIVERLYFSVVTFSTLGFGDVLPKTTFSMCLVIVEVMFGYIMQWVMMTILGKKIFR
jgi:hypothetical protein